MFHRDFNNFQHNFQYQERNDRFETAQELNLHTSLAHKEKLAAVPFSTADKFADTGKAVKGEKTEKEGVKFASILDAENNVEIIGNLLFIPVRIISQILLHPKKEPVKYGNNLYHYHKDLYLLKRIMSFIMKPS